MTDAANLCKKEVKRNWAVYIWKYLQRTKCHRRSDGACNRATVGTTCKSIQHKSTVNPHPSHQSFTYSRSRFLNSLKTPGPNFSILLKCRYLEEHTNTWLAIRITANPHNKRHWYTISYLCLTHLHRLSFCIKSQGYIRLSVTFSYNEYLWYITQSFNQERKFEQAVRWCEPENMVLQMEGYGFDFLKAYRYALGSTELLLYSNISCVTWPRTVRNTVNKRRHVQNIWKPNMTYQNMWHSAEI